MRLFLLLVPRCDSVELLTVGDLELTILALKQALGYKQVSESLTLAGFTLIRSRPSIVNGSSLKASRRASVR
jgi:hypothetical protein